MQLEFGCTRSKLSKLFQIKNKTKFEHYHDVVHLGTCPETIAQIIMLMKTHIVSLTEQLITVVGTKTRTFSSIVVSKTTQIL